MGMNLGPQFFPQPQMMQGPPNPPGSFAGVCYKCNQQGHMARACPTAMRGNPAQGGGGVLAEALLGADLPEGEDQDEHWGLTKHCVISFI